MRTTSGPVVVFGIALLALLLQVEASGADIVAPPPPETVAAFKLSTNHTKCVLVESLPVVGSARVSDYGMREAAWLIRHQIGHRPEVLRAMASNNVRFVVMASTEMTTDVPEHSDLTPKAYWDRRARGLGATAARPAVSCGEENLLCLRGDPYGTENILIHEFAHAIHERGLNSVDPSFDRGLLAAYEHAKSNGLWKGTYAMQNRMEYWAEGTQSWFDTNRANDKEHGPVDTREKLKAYDQPLAVLLAEVYGDSPWRYQRPEQRTAAERAHLAGFDRMTFPAFTWPKAVARLEEQGQRVPWIAPDQIPSASPRTAGKKTDLNFVNRRARTVTVDWLDAEGHRKHYADVRPGLTYLTGTYAGHVWVISEDGRVLGAVVATEVAGRVEIK